MGACIYCGKSAGVFRTMHAECEQRYQKQERRREAGRQRIVDEVSRAIRASEGFDELETRLGEIERASAVPLGDRGLLLAAGWEKSVEQFLEDGVLDAAEETRLANFTDRFALSQGELDKNGALTRTVKAGILREVLSGSIPQRASLDAPLPINLQKGERVVWVFAGARYFEDKVRREFVGGSQGVSVRVMRGVYYRVGAFKGHAVEHTERVLVDTGMMVVTERNIYFVGPKKSLRIPYAKIVSFEPFADGIGLMRDSTSAKPQIFVTGDGWFTYNLVTNLARIYATT